MISYVYKEGDGYFYPADSGFFLPALTTDTGSITVVIGISEEGKVFDRWMTDDGVEFSDASSVTTTFTMSAKDVAVTAAYKDKDAANNGAEGPEKPEPVLTPSENKAMDVRMETVGDCQVTYAHQVPFPGKGKLTVESFGENFTVSQGNVGYKVKKIKVNKKKRGYRY